jgi:predicted transposase/invertase (TIGR01784 family)
LREVDEEKEIFPEYYLIQVERFENVINSSLDEWIYMLKNEKVRDDFTARNIDQAKKKLSVLRMGEKERKRYESYLMSLASERDIMESAHQEGLAEGLKKGLEEGRKEGLEEGLHKGLEEGRKEGLEEGKKKGRLETARKMLAKGYTPGEIAEVTGLAVEDILDFIGDK